MNPYETLVAVSANSPDELVSEITKIRTPIKILAIVPYGSRQVAYIVGDLRKPQPPPKNKGK